MKKMIWVSLVLFLAGCASVENIDHGFKGVDYDDGISAAEAKIIARKFLLKDREAEKYAVTMPQLDTGFLPSFPEWKGKAWVVAFSSKSVSILDLHGHKSFVVGVDRNTGNIRFYMRGYNRPIPEEMENYGEEGLSIRE